MGEEKIFNVEKMVDQYVSKFPVNVVVDKVFLFGSYATGQARDDSDVDLIVLSDVISNMVNGRTICVFADALAFPVVSYMKKFLAEFEEHIKLGRCPCRA